MAVLLATGNGTSLAQTPVAGAEAAARAGAAEPEGKRIQEAVGLAFGREHAATVGACAKEVKSPDLSPFALYLRLDSAGVVGEVLAKPDTNLARCVRGRLVGWRASAPAPSERWVQLDVKLKRR